MGVLARVPRMEQAPGALGGIGALAAELAARGGAVAGPVLLVADPGLVALGIAAAAEAALARAGLAVATFTAFKSDPSCAQVDAAATLARESGAGVVVALGGGSALDVGKAVAAIAPGAEGAAAYELCARPFPGGTLGTICVPTTSGTGSETTRTSVLTNAGGAKVWLWGEELKADAVVLDPELTVGLPEAMTAWTGIDALVHALEAATNVNAHAANDVYAHEAIRLVVRHLGRALEAPGDLEARAGLQRAAAFAGIAIDNCGTAVAHNIGHALASLRPVHHGRAVGIALNATLAWNAAYDPDGRYAAVAGVMGEEPQAVALPGAFDRLLRATGQKLSLAGEGFDDITVSRLAAQMAAPENAPMRRANRRPVGDADLETLAAATLEHA